MRVLAALSTMCLVALAMAQNTTSANTTNIVIEVGAGQTAAGGPFQFMPPNITATNGTVISFTFTGSPGNHSITQSTFADPCTPLDGGFSSGFIFIPANTSSGFPVWNLTVEDDRTPIWFFCAQIVPVPHCGSGMVGSINAPSNGTNTFPTFQNNAKALNGTIPPTPSGALNGSGAAASLLPGPLTGSITGFALPSGSTPTPTAPASSGSGSASGSGAAPNPTVSTSGSARGLVVGGVVGFVSAVLGVLLI